ncbi:MAG TPA: hypothetical protein VIN07_06190 [Flavipsychrobacter sp.]
MRNAYLILLSLIAVSFSSCYTYKVYPEEYRRLENIGAKPKAYVINDTLDKELNILVSSGIFTIIKDSTEADLQIHIYPLEQNMVCGQGLTASMITLGQLPVFLPDRYFYRFDEIGHNGKTHRKIELKIAQRVWFWDVFVFNKRFEENAGKALLGGYRDGIE